MANEVAKKTLGAKPEETVEESTNDKKHSETVPYDRFSQVISEKKELELKLKEFQDKQTKEQEEKEIELAKKTGEFEKLKEQLSKKDKLMKERAGDMVKTSVALRAGIGKPEYTKLLDIKVDVDDNLEVKNTKEIEEYVEKFKKDNPNLFVDPKVKVPATDSSKPVTNRQVPPSDMTTAEKLSQGMQERLQKLDSLHRISAQ